MKPLKLSSSKTSKFQFCFKFSCGTISKKLVLFLSTYLILQVTLFLSVPLKLNAQCLTTDLDISTGYDHENAVFYSQGASDQYWRLVAGPGAYAPYPFCAISQGQGNAGYVANNTRISVNFTSVCEGNMQGNVNNCNWTGNPYVFQRSFSVNTGALASVNGTIDIPIFIGDLNVSQIKLYGPGLGGGLVLDNNCWPQGIVNLAGSWTIPLKQEFTLFSLI